MILWFSKAIYVFSLILLQGQVIRYHLIWKKSSTIPNKNMHTSFEKKLLSLHIKVNAGKNPN
jgi:hypothetical protein